MRQGSPQRLAHGSPENPEISPRPHAASGSDHPLHILLLNRDAFLLTYVWHLTAFFERVCPARLRIWECRSYGDIALTLDMAAISESVRVADWVVFCQATPATLPSHVRRWVESWHTREHNSKAWVGYFVLNNDDLSLEDNTEAYLRKMAQSINRDFVAVCDYLLRTRGDFEAGTMAHKPGMVPDCKDSLCRNG